ncbi:uncharacterized protein FIBRA_00037 [Fibroporia radiculosa]|uniref:Uncharacterized protein n=1 Tax=Fibroporia radiculosa TaxID=599839 RepID=J7SCE4_9APHY|nr:uncharacterized protein FIBRA_00037 [Fibroporia radiculosa]CCL98043.1 predicted protein [Fibroporia radiculosa]
MANFMFVIARGRPEPICQNGTEPFVPKASVLLFLSSCAKTMAGMRQKAGLRQGHTKASAGQLPSTHRSLRPNRLTFTTHDELINKLLPGLKRRSRSQTKSETTPTKARPLTILPHLSEEDEGRPSCSSATSSESATAYRGSRSITLGGYLSAKDLAERKRDSRRVVLTGAEGLTFDDFFPLYGAPPRPAPAPPLYDIDTAACDSPLDDINLRFSGLGISLDFPSPPADVTSTPSSRRRGRSPTPSVSSSITSNTTSSSSSSDPKVVHFTPPTSDDESRPNLQRAPTCKSHRASIYFAKSMPDLNVPEVVVESESENEEDIQSDVEWFANDISDVVTLSSPLPPSFPLAACSSNAPDLRARPDSILPPPRRAGRSRNSKPLPNVPRLSVQDSSKTSGVQGRPSAQLDPTFPSRRKSFLIPSRPPPPPPIKVSRCSTSTMERETEELLAQLASAALGAGFLGTGLSALHNAPLSASVPPSPSSAYIVTHRASARPPPRMSLPADISDLSDEAPYTPGATAELEIEIIPEMDEIPTWPKTPQSASVYSQASMSAGSLPVSPASSFSFDISFVHGDSPVENNVDNEVPHTPTEPFVPERVLRSRWSSSTLSSQFDREPASSWISRFHLSPSKRGKGKSLSPPSTPSKRSSPPKSPLSPMFKRSLEFDRLERRDSCSSHVSDARSDSGDSTASSGLRRKPIPVEMFIRA